MYRRSNRDTGETAWNRSQPWLQMSEIPVVLLLEFGMFQSDASPDTLMNVTWFSTGFVLFFFEKGKCFDVFKTSC